MARSTALVGIVLALSGCAADVGDEDDDDVEEVGDVEEAVTRGQSGKSCHDSYNHTCAMKLAPAALAARQIHPVRLRADGSMAPDACTVVTGGKTIGADRRGRRVMRDDAVALNRAVWKNVAGVTYYFAWLPRVEWTYAPGCGPAPKPRPYLKSGWLNAAAFASSSEVRSAVTMQGKYKNPIGTDARKGKDGSSYTVAPQSPSAQEHECGMKPGVTSAAQCWHYLDLDADVGRGHHEVYIAAGIGEAGIEFVPEGATFVVEEDGDGRILRERDIFDMRGSARKPLGKMRYVYGHVAGSRIHGWMAAANLRRGNAQLCGFRTRGGTCVDGL